MRQDDPTVRNADAMARAVWDGTPHSDDCPYSTPHLMDGDERCDYDRNIRAMLAFAALSPADGDAGAIRAAVIERLRELRDTDFSASADEPETIADWRNGFRAGVDQAIVTVHALTPTETGEQGK